ncbi:MAG: NADH-quinone oxidoreductase subunit L [Marinobacter sp.]
MSSFGEIASLVVLAAWLLLVVSLFAVAALSGWLRNPLKLEHCWRLSGQLLLASMGVTLLAAGAVVGQSFSGSTIATDAGRQFGLYPDGISVWMALMVSFIGWVILRFASTYLKGDPGRDRFLSWFLVIIGSVLVLVFTSHLLVLAGAWIGISLALHHLLTLYRDRPEARMAAVQKFIVSRIGDSLIIIGVVLLYMHYGTFHLPDMLSISRGGIDNTGNLTLASVALALAAALKCAQIPFHGWLIRVMEAPTPVSALLHAGVINLGGFLWLRLFPLFDGFTVGHMILLVVGGISALVAVMTMMTQTSVKHALAWSTCAQMGFMLFEIGMGAYTLAFLHLLAHSLYKAHSFLASGRTVVVTSRLQFPDADRPTRVLWALGAAAVAAAILVAAPRIVEHNVLLGALLVFAVAAATLGIPATTAPAERLKLTGLAVMLVPVYVLCHLVIGPAVPVHPGFVLPAAAYGAGGVILLALAVTSLLVSLAPRHPLARELKVHFGHGLYLEQPLDRLTRRLASGALRVPAMFHKVPHRPFTREEKS